MKKAYVILRKKFEYDDNIYFETVGGGYPKLVVFSAEDARSKINELNAKELKECSLSDYSYEIEDLLNVEMSEYIHFNKSLDIKYGQSHRKNNWENKLHPMANKEETLKYMQMVDISFYEFIETDIDIMSLRNKQINRVIDL